MNVRLFRLQSSLTIDKGKDMLVKSAQTVKHSSSIFQIIDYHLENLLDTPVHSKVNFFLTKNRPNHEGLGLGCLLFTG